MIEFENNFITIWPANVTCGLLYIDTKIYEKKS